ncbi:hypothetical protein M408DRAFT_330941 [Serendipita vermifera MAFF 305830]|uniref:Uncharacterized protein n=1 Tax=Serendipita vermifera MAFF 305830 TaxID=933852 RepID=A0A0C3B348_SERVB|nr:hypothetical protein M408DRAFT_330941 [Serendipita vermifera MAFF 305830]
MLLKDSGSDQTVALTLPSSEAQWEKFNPSTSSINTQSNPVFPNDTKISVASILGGFGMALALCVLHHLLLSYLHGQNIDHFSQFWIKNASNGFASVFSVCLAFSMHCALTQVKWRIARKNPIPLGCLDSLFAMPSPLALLGSFLSPCRPLFFPILTSIIIQALLIVGILAPNALEIAPSTPVTRNIQVPTLDFSKGPLTSLTMALGVSYTNVSSSWEQIINMITLNPPEVNWEMPRKCGAACSFQIEYQAPSLDCRDIGPEEYVLSPGNIMDKDHAWVYQANSTLYPSPAVSRGEWDIGQKYDLSIQYANLSDENMLHSQRGGGVYCHFRNATYTASFDFTSSYQRAKTSIVSYGSILGGRHDCLTYDLPSDEQDACMKNGINTRATCQVFAAAFQGYIGYDEAVMSGEIHSPGFVGMAGNMALVQTMFHYASISGPPFGEFEPLVPDLGKALVDTFSNLTLGLMPHRTEKTTVTALVWDGEQVWGYTVWLLWAVYAPALLLALPVMIAGLFSIRSNGVAMEDSFSTFLLATRNPELDHVCAKVAEPKRLQHVRLLYQRKGTFMVESKRESSD